ncbi:MAG: asparagine--tRNA ligase [Phycisphaeraceae bacterium]|nr:MAG: asparagine--tRNA ligase [Phycisphaeraceae bacterium]
MAWTKIKDALSTAPGAEVTLKGWVRTRRDSKAAGGLSFIALHDGTCHDAIQVVAKGDLPNYESEVARLTTGCAIEADGVLVESKGKGQTVEVQASALRVIGWVEDPDTYPVPQKRHTMEYLREQAHLRVRTNTFGAVARVRHALAAGVHRFFDERDFYYVHTPIITGSDAEGAGEMFRVSTLDMLNVPTAGGAVDYTDDFFGKESNLTVSGQLNVETYCAALSRVYTFGPTFRAENSNTSRHLAEFWMIEPEIAFANLSDNWALAEEMLKYLLDDVLTRRADDMAFFDLRIEKGLIDRLKHVIETPFRVLPYTEAIDILAKSNQKFEYPVKWGLDMQSEHERYLTEEHFKQPVVVINYPKDIKAFYMRVNDAGTDGAPGDTVAAMDILVPGIGEIVGGSQREERLDVLDARIAEMKLDKDDYWWYRDLRKYGTVPHAGFGLGFERLIQFCTGMQNIRDVIPFPRAPRQCEF